MVRGRRLRARNRITTKERRIVIFRRLFGRTQQEEQQKQEVALTKTRRTNLFGSLFERSTIDEELYEDLETALIGSDVGVETTDMLINDLRAHVRQNGVRDPKEAKQHLKGAMVYLLEDTKRERTVKVFQRGVPWVMMVVGVNGAGKTTTIGKLAYLHKSAGRKVMIAAGDTFRAAAIEQLQTWSAERLGGVPVIATKQGGDPGAVVFDAMAAAHNREMDILIVDTAGRLENKEPLMRELEKVRGIMKKTVPDAPQETLLVIDANTGQNGLHQARIFTERVDVTEIALAKLDGTAKGGIAFAIVRALGIPISYVGVGEQADDLIEFDARRFVDALFGDDEYGTRGA
jgi:fused signal recognition particle receptor